MAEKLENIPEAEIAVNWKSPLSLIKRIKKLCLERNVKLKDFYNYAIRTTLENLEQQPSQSQRQNDQNRSLEI
jgi:hypothetical protein